METEQSNTPLSFGATAWWRNLTVKQREYIIGNNYADNEVTNERIENLYQIDKKLPAEHSIDPNRF